MTGPLASTSTALSKFMRDFFVAEQITTREGFLQACDPRGKLLASVVLVLAAMLTRSIPALIALSFVIVVLAVVSAVPLHRLATRSTVVPLASFLVVLPQLVLLPGEPVATVAGISITWSGVAYVATFTFRVSVGVGILSLLVLTTPFSSMVAAMRALGIPTTLVWVVAITFRYLFLLFDELMRLLRARNSRTTGRQGMAGEWRDARRLSGSFLLRTFERGERVGRSMRARGGARPPSPYERSSQWAQGDYVLVSLSLFALLTSVVIRWGL
jgi:cobalt/nickel transport system permease protein